MTLLVRQSGRASGSRTRTKLVSISPAPRHQPLSVAIRPLASLGTAATGAGIPGPMARRPARIVVVGRGPGRPGAGRPVQRRVGRGADVTGSGGSPGVGGPVA